MENEKENETDFWGMNDKAYPIKWISEEEEE